MSSVFFNKGENCIAAGRLFVEESIHDEFVERVVSFTLDLKKLPFTTVMAKTNASHTVKPHLFGSHLTYLDCSLIQIHIWEPIMIIEKLTHLS